MIVRKEFLEFLSFIVLANAMGFYYFKGWIAIINLLMPNSIIGFICKCSLVVIPMSFLLHEIAIAPVEDN